MVRKALSKKVRFEVFKRDRFTCQYCGRKAPDVVLNVDHIKPIAEGGSNDILNLITSCFECNNGKSATPLSKTEIVDKQRNQIELLQERREQIDMMFEWQKSLEGLDNYVLDKLVQHIEDKIMPYHINEQCKQELDNMVKKYSLEDVLKAFDEGCSRYLKRDCNNILEKESINILLSKIEGIIKYSKRPKSDLKIHYIKGICRNRFDYWDDKMAIMILTEYLKALRSKGYSEESILDDLNGEASDLAKNARSWSEWKNTMEAWIDDIKSWEDEATKK